MPMLTRISGVSAGGTMEHAGVIPAGALHAAADTRIFPVPDRILPLLRKADLQPPPPGETYNMAELDRKLAVLAVDERIMCKQCLAHAGLMRS
jgi:hypothetical protein